MSRWRPDEIIVHEDGSRTEIRYQRWWEPFRPQAQMRREYDADGNLREVWHEVINDDGSVRHRDRKA
jgi:hypothetical protein